MRRIDELVVLTLRNDQRTRSVDFLDIWETNDLDRMDPAHSFDYSDAIQMKSLFSSASELFTESTPIRPP